MHFFLGCLKEMKALQDFNDLVYLIDSKAKQNILINQSQHIYVAPRVRFPTIDWLIQKRALDNQKVFEAREIVLKEESTFLMNEQDGVNEAENLDDEVYGTWIEDVIPKKRSIP